MDRIESAQKREEAIQRWKESLPPEQVERIERVEGLPPSLILQVLKMDLLERRSNPAISRQDRQAMLVLAKQIAEYKQSGHLLCQIERLLHQQDVEDAKLLLELMKYEEPNSSPSTVNQSVHIHGEDVQEKLREANRILSEYSELVDGKRTWDMDTGKPEDSGQEGEVSPLQDEQYPEEDIPEGSSEVD